MSFKCCGSYVLELTGVILSLFLLNSLDVLGFPKVLGLLGSLPSIVPVPARAARLSSGAATLRGSPLPRRDARFAPAG